MSYPDTFLAAALAELADAALAGALRCDGAVVWQLRLARRSRPSSSDADVTRLAVAVSCPPRRLAAPPRGLGAPRASSAGWQAESDAMS